jgi:hypothetical protein
MHPTVQPVSHAVILVRKEFDLASKPTKFVIHLLADNHYRLFVNGQYLSRGPARGDIAHWFYDTIDLAEYFQVVRVKIHGDGNKLILTIRNGFQPNGEILPEAVVSYLREGFFLAAGNC